MIIEPALTNWFENTKLAGGKPLPPPGDLLPCETDERAVVVECVRAAATVSTRLVSIKTGRAGNVHRKVHRSVVRHDLVGSEVQDRRVIARVAHHGSAGTHEAILDNQYCRIR